MIPSPRRTLAVVRAHLHSSLALAFQYRLEFFIEGVLTVLWTVVTLVPLIVLFRGREQVAGWTYPESLLVVGWFVLLKAFLDGIISPSLILVVEHVRKGTLDFILLKPADAQLLVSIAKIEPWRVIDLAAAAAIFVHAFRLLGRTPTGSQLLLCALLLAAAALMLYSIAIVVIAIAFIAVRIDNLLYMFQSLFDLARWPSTIFRGALAIVFTFVLPLAVMTTFPALALLGRLGPRDVAQALASSAVFAVLSRVVWRASLAKYTSASS